MNEGETLGKYLKQQRESKKISLREVAKSTKVRENILRAIEEDQHHLLPAATYVKGFLLSYAKYLHLNPNDVLLRYERTLRGETIPSGPSPLSKPEQESTPSPPPETKAEVSPTSAPVAKQEIPSLRAPRSKQKILWNTRQVAVLGGVIVVSLIIFYFFYPHSSKLPLDSVPGKPPSEGKPSLTPSPPTLETSSVSLPTPSPTVTPPPAIPEIKPFALRLKAVEETWVSVQVDDQPGKEMTFQPEQGISLQASNQIRMIIGNAGGLELILGGKALDKFGKSGEVVTVLITSQGVEVKRHEKPKPVQE
ncbi:MAG: helix-turn-helix domain-containing protein [Syntrophaceae bacterium]|nr:helix-turn-helix domain-containing protein [Syntrophaceae bacterium]